MAVQALARIKQGATTALQFELPDTAARIEATGKVAWVNVDTGRAGIHFQSLTDSSAASLKQWLEAATAPTRQPSQPASEAQPSETEATSSATPSLLDVPQEQAISATPRGLPTIVPAPPRLGPESRVAEIAALQREISNQGLDRDAALALTVERARTLTRADGVAIVLGDADRMACRASCGSAPPVGAELQPDSGLSGECVRSGVTVRCEDTELDPRVEREACQALNLRSAVVVPLFARGNISGLVEVFYSVPRGFEGRDVLTLRRIADLVSATLCAPPSREENPSQPVATLPSSPAIPRRATPPGSLIPPAPRLASVRDKTLCNVCGHSNPPAASTCEKCHATLAAEEGIAPTPSSTLFTSASERPRGLRALRLNLSPRVLVLIILLVLLVSLWGWQAYKSRQANASPPARTTSALGDLRSHAAAFPPLAD